MFKKRLSVVFAAYIAVISFTVGVLGCGNGIDPNHEHEYVVSYVAPTCTDKGYTLHKCKCGKSFKDEYIDEKGHSFGDHTSDGNGDCSHNSTESAVCKNCGTVDSREIPDSKVSGIHLDNNGICEYCGEPIPYSQGLLYSETENGYRLYSLGMCTDKAIYMPAEHNGKPVTAFSESLFRDHSEMTYISIGRNIETIPERAFSGCSGLSGELYIPDSVLYIQAQAFYALKYSSLNIGKGLADTHREAFMLMTDLKKISVRKGNKKYSAEGNCLIAGNQSVVLGCISSVIPTKSSITGIGNYAFCGYEGESIYIPQNITSLNMYSFGYSKLKTVTFASSSHNLGDHGFYFCKQLESMVIGKRCIVDYGATSYASALKYIYYSGTKSEYKKGVDVSSENGGFNKATKYYYSDTNPYQANPSDTDKYWHYADGKATVWEKSE